MKKQLQSLLGKLLYIHGCVSPACVFVNRLLNTLRRAAGHVKVDLEMDLNWFICFLQQFNGIIMFYQAEPSINIFVDASLLGMMACWHNNVYAISRHIYATLGLNITQLEMF